MRGLIAPLTDRTLGAALDELGLWSGELGFTEQGPNTIEHVPDESGEVAQGPNTIALHLLIEVLKSGAAVLVDAAGKEVPQGVFLSGRWTHYRNEHAVERLVWMNADGNEVEYVNLRFKGKPGETPAASQKSPEQLAWDFALEILDSPKAPPRIRGWKIKIARLVHAKLKSLGHVLGRL